MDPPQQERTEKQGSRTERVLSGQVVQSSVGRKGGIHFEKGQTGSRKKSDYEETEKTDQAETLQQSEALVRCIMNRAERRAKGIKGKVAVYNLTNDQIQGIKDDAAFDAVLLMLAIPVMVIHDKFGDLMRKEGREERFAEHCLRTLEAVQDGLVTLDELKQVLYEETGMKVDYST